MLICSGCAKAAGDVPGRGHTAGMCQHAFRTLGTHCPSEGVLGWVFGGVVGGIVGCVVGRGLGGVVGGVGGSFSFQKVVIIYPKLLKNVGRRSISERTISTRVFSKVQLDGTPKEFFWFAKNTSVQTPTNSPLVPERVKRICVRRTFAYFQGVVSRIFSDTINIYIGIPPLVFLVNHIS